MAEAPRAEDAILLAGQLQPDLVLMNIRLAGEMDGLTAAQIIRDRFSIPVEFLPALAGDLITTQANPTELFNCTIKPLGARELQTVIEMALCKQRAERPGAAPVTDPKYSALPC